ncbi:hypothetical protein F3J20_30690 [Paraburkholderia sp. Cy-641]|nr:hypothetical protein [Paraburkholderia sp. Cy-641]
MSMRLRFLLDTNVLIPLQDTYQVLESNLANFVRLAGLGGQARRRDRREPARFNRRCLAHPSDRQDALA